MSLNKLFITALGLGLCAVPAQAETTSLARLIGLGQSVQCSYQKTDTDGTQNGTLYLANQKMRGEIQTPASGMMSMLREGDWQYMWGDAFGPGQGMKMNVTAARSGRAPHGQQGPDVNEEMDYQCKPWPVDESMFVVPADVQFMDMGQMTGMGAAGGGIDMRAIQCGACDQAPADQQAACRQALGC